ncbi:lipoprotein, partial [mine drainage metagenome]
MKWHKFLVPTTLLVMLAGCASMNIQAQQPLRPAAGTAWAVLPFANNTETPVANARAAALAAALLQSDGQRVLGTLPISSRL